MKQILKKKKIVNIRNLEKSKYKSFYKISIISFFIIFTFSFLPDTVDYLKKNVKANKIVLNNSNKTFEEVIKKGKLNKEQKQKPEEKLNLRNIFSDIDFFKSNKKTTNTSRLSASTIEQLFEDTKYDLKNVRDTKLVNIGNSIDHLPREIKNIENVKKRKKLFIQIVLPLVIEENTKIRLERKKLFAILNRSNNSEKEKKWLNKKFKQYGVKNKDLSTLKIRMDEIPASLAIAQAAKETGWGTSRFAQDGNALFGQWTWSGEGIKPYAANVDSKHKVAKFKVLKASVRAYQRNLNTHSSYRKFREERAIQRDNHQKLSSLKLVNYLDKYAETGVEYTKILKKIIKQNSLTDFDDVKMLSTSNRIKSLI